MFRTTVLHCDHHVQYGQSLPPSATASVIFPPTEGYNFRYVIIQQQFADTDAICLAEVKVFLRGSLPYIIT